MMRAALLVYNQCSPILDCFFLHHIIYKNKVIKPCISRLVIKGQCNRCEINVRTLQGMSKMWTWSINERVCMLKELSFTIFAIAINS